MFFGYVLSSDTRSEGRYDGRGGDDILVERVHVDETQEHCAPRDATQAVQLHMTLLRPLSDPFHSPDSGRYRELETASAGLVGTVV